MKVLLIKPMEHPQVVDIENSLKEFYRILDCDCITAVSYTHLTLPTNSLV